MALTKKRVVGLFNSNRREKRESHQIDKIRLILLQKYRYLRLLQHLIVESAIIMNSHHSRAELIMFIDILILQRKRSLQASYLLEGFPLKLHKEIWI
jgi:hypothetical protein